MTGGEAVLFWVLAPLMVISAAGLLVVRRAVHAAICVVFVMIGLAVLYVTQGAPFLGIVQIVVYTGAVMMLFLFVLMLVGIDAADSLTETIRGQRWIGLLLGLGLFGVLAGVIARAAFPPARGIVESPEVTNPVALARVLFGDYVIAMQVVGILLVTAALAGLMLTHRQRLGRKPTQRALAEAKVAALPQGRMLTPLPAPGVYAQNNAMDTPALGPDGQPLPHSVPRVLRIRGQERSVTEMLAADEMLAGRVDAAELAAEDRGAKELDAVAFDDEPDAARPDAGPDDATGEGEETR